MNDPGLHDPINQTSDNIESDRKDEEDAAKDDEQAYLNPSRWWFASTAFPLLAGTFGPMASAFNICALVVHWRVEIPPGLGANESHGDDVRDPKWLLAVNGLSLGTALIANFSLLLNMARRLGFSIAQPITIIGWYISSFLLIGDLSGIIHIVKRPQQRRALTQAFYYAIFAASIYFIIATLMVVTVYGAWRGHYSREFKLTTSQRTLMLQTISFMIYMVGGAGVFAKIEGWMFLDAMYFVNYTLLTVGIGDYAPQTHLGRGLLFPFAIGGIVVLGLVIGSIRSLVLERGKNKLGSRMTEKKREALIQEIYQKGDATRITPLNGKKEMREAGMSERERREAEFNLMRQVQQSTATRQKWLALSISGGAWLLLWFIGALVFYFAEHEQGWTYFQSLYFCYTTLLTIGYGDYKPFSNSGKAFFVFWSLLAVPTLTIVISNMGDTVVKLIRDGTLYLGEFTVLPGEAGLGTRLKQIANKAGPRKFTGSADETLEDEPPGLLGEKEEAPHRGHLHHGADKSAKERKDSELKAAKSEHDEGNDKGSSIHVYHYSLAKEFRNVMKHLNESPPRKYTYDEWAYYLKLMGEDEESSTSHRKPPVLPKKDGEQNGGDGEVDMQQAQTEDDTKGNREWSWLGERSPLMGEMEEAEWVLERLAGRLERCLRDINEEHRRGSRKIKAGGSGDKREKTPNGGGAGEMEKDE